jgi:hypothetical protein
MLSKQGHHIYPTFLETPQEKGFMVSQNIRTGHLCLPTNFKATTRFSPITKSEVEGVA